MHTIIYNIYVFYIISLKLLSIKSYWNIDMKLIQNITLLIVLIEVIIA